MSINIEYPLLPYSISVPLVLTIESSPELYSGSYDEIIILANCKQKAIDIVNQDDELSYTSIISSTDPVVQAKVDEYKFIDHDMLLTHITAALYDHCIRFQCPPDSIKYTIKLNPYEQSEKTTSKYQFKGTEMMPVELGIGILALAVIVIIVGIALVINERQYV